MGLTPAKVVYFILQSILRKLILPFDLGGMVATTYFSSPGSIPAVTLLDGRYSDRGGYFTPQTSRTAAIPETDTSAVMCASSENAMS
jgi:hypothetical protein